MTVADIKAYLHIDSDLTDDDGVLGDLIEAAHESIESETGKAYDDTKALMRDYVRLYVKQRYENNGEAVLDKAIYSLKYHIMRSSDFKDIADEEETTGGTSTEDNSSDSTSSDGSESSETTDGESGETAKSEDGGANESSGESDGT